MNFFLQVPTDLGQVSAIMETLQTQLTGLGLKLGGAILLWLVASWLIRKAIGLLSRVLKKQSIDPTLIRYLVNFLGILLNIVLVVAILGYFGIETTSFAALLAAAGVAIGAAWSGLLANFAAGVFLIIFRPFSAGDFIEAGGTMGTVAEIGLFVTAIDTLDNVRTLVGNNTIFAGTIQNFSTNPYRRVDLVAQLNHGVAPEQAIALLKESVSNIDNVIAEPAPDVEILEFNLAGTLLAVRPYCNNADYWQVYFDTNKAIAETCGAAGFPTPETHYALRQVAP